MLFFQIQNLDNLIYWLLTFKLDIFTCRIWIQIEILFRSRRVENSGRMNQMANHAKGGKPATLKLEKFGQLMVRFADIFIFSMCFPYCLHEIFISKHKQIKQKWSNMHAVIKDSESCFRSDFSELSWDLQLFSSHLPQPRLSRGQSATVDAILWGSWQWNFPKTVAQVQL